MAEPTSTTDRIVAAAEVRMRHSGFHGFSFREVAADVGIKSASVHHHFPTKEDLGAAVVRSYTEGFIASLGDPADSERSPAALMADYIGSFRKSYGKDLRMCLCGLLSSEGASMPVAINAAVRDFFDRNLAWLETGLARSSPDDDPRNIKIKALRIVAMLEGAMLLGRSLHDLDVFEQIIAVLDEAPFAPARAT